MSQVILEDQDSIDVEPGVVISDTRGGNDSVLYRVVYADDCRVLMRSNKHHKRTGDRHYRNDFREQFEQYMISGRYERRPDNAEAPSMPSEADAEEMEWSELRGIGAGTQEKLREAGIKTDMDLREADDSYVVEIYSMSEVKLDRMKEFIQ
jgi:predicted flap endonuclease-1-like 5' DNA nuclease